MASSNKKEDIELGRLYENIIALCERNGIKGGKMCSDLGLSKGLLSDLKSGRRSGVSAVTAQRIASYFDISVGMLLDGAPNSKEHNGEAAFTLIACAAQKEPPLNEHETRLIEAYRLHPEFQDAVDRLLGIDDGNGYLNIYSAASSTDNQPDNIISMKKEEWEKLKTAEETDDTLL